MGVVGGHVSDAARVLVVNVGSSSVKLRLLGADDGVLEARDLAAPSGDRDELQRVLATFDGVALVGHRIVHGGTRFTAATLVDDGVRAALAALTDLAPLHQPPALAALDDARAALPGARHVACFDTAFHATLPVAAATYAVPEQWRRDLGVRRYGFHGLSHAYAARRACELLDCAPAGLRIVTCHLGAGASLCAVRDGRSHDTTMGFTPLEGLVMATRAGSVDPGLVLWLIRHAGIDPATVEDALERRSGLVALAATPDMQEVLARAAGEEPSAVLALDVYCHRLRGSIASMAASLGGLDVLVFTGGVGERAAEVRRRAADGLAFLGVALADGPDARAGAVQDSDVSAAGARVRTLVVHAREDLEIARQARAVSA